MRITILPVGVLERETLSSIQSGLSRIFSRSLCHVADDVLPVSMGAYVFSRRQYVSTKILSDILGYTEKMGSLSERVYRVLGVTDVDLFVPGMNFVFGEAQCPGTSALISLFRLRPEFYGEPANKELFHERALKEAVHELGHTLGIRHCKNPLCVMYFSLHIGMTDRKLPSLCPYCRSEAEKTTRTL